MSETKLKQIAQDIAFIKQRIVYIEEEIENIYGVRSSYLKKLNKIEKGKFYSYSNIEDLRKELEK